MSNENNGMQTEMLEAMKAQMAEMRAMMAEIQAENQRLKSEKAVEGLRLAISEKGAVSLYGVGRFPTTLYRSQWLRILTAAKEGMFDRFFESNKAKLDAIDASNAEAKDAAKAAKEAERQARVASFISGGTAHKVG